MPAVVAGVPEIAIFTPPAPDGTVDAGELVAARIAGVERVYKCGGSQAVAAAAYGTETVRKVVKIVGPGSPWVVAAKRLLADVIDAGLPAGPSEVDRPRRRHASTAGSPALDLLIEAEHGPDSSAYLVTPEPQGRRGGDGRAAGLLGGDDDAAARRFLAHRADRPARRHRARAVDRGGLPLRQRLRAGAPGDPLDRAVRASRPHHQCRGDSAGPHTPITIANFVLGPNGVLPTGGWARTFGPLSVTDFMKRSSIGYVTSAAYPELARRAKRLSEYEGFSSHANAVSEIRDKLLG